MHYVQKNNLFLARIPRILANSYDNYRRYCFQAFVKISGKFPENSENIKFPENPGNIKFPGNLQPYLPGYLPG